MSPAPTILLEVADGKPVITDIRSIHVHANADRVAREVVADLLKQGAAKLLHPTESRP